MSLRIVFCIIAVRLCVTSLCCEPDVVSRALLLLLLLLFVAEGPYPEAIVLEALALFAVCKDAGPDFILTCLWPKAA